MHRQSLGSSSSKLQNHGVINEHEEKEEEETLKHVDSFCHHNFLHLIPILTLLCFFLLYLFSHPLSPSELHQFTRSSHRNLLESMKEVRDNDQHYLDEKRGDVLVLRNLHRKLANF